MAVLRRVLQVGGISLIVLLEESAVLFKEPIGSGRVPFMGRIVLFMGRDPLFFRPSWWGLESFPSFTYMKAILPLFFCVVITGV